MRRYFGLREKREEREEGRYQICDSPEDRAQEERKVRTLDTFSPLHDQ